MTYNKQHIIEENLKRLAFINTPYNPMVGTEYCDTIKRNALYIKDAPIPLQNIPIEMEAEPIVQLLRKTKTLKRAAKLVLGNDSEKSIIAIWRRFLKVRCTYDFEFECATQIKIKLKGKPRRDYLILNRAQRYYLGQLEALRKANKPIFIILLKARQWGGSTLTEFYMMWIQKRHRKNWNSVIIGDIEKQSKVILSMYERAMEDYDTFVDDGVSTKLVPFGRTNDIRMLEGRDCTISVGSMQRPDKIRSEDISMAHFTEFGLWKSTLSKTPEDVLQSIDGTILDAPYSLWVIESTAKGVGNDFHNQYIAAKKGESKFHAVFVPWFMIDMYSRFITNSISSTATQSDIDAYPSFIESMSEYEWFLWEQGATLEAIHWYRVKSKGVDDARMKSEFPSTDIEAFQSTGRMIFNESYIADCERNCKQPLMVGEIVSKNSILNRKEFLKDLRFEKNPRGGLKVWADVDTSVDMSNRYLVTVDLGKGSSANADNTIVCVFDRYWQHPSEDGYPEVVAEWSGKESETDLLAWRIAQIAAYYNNALLVIESNTLDTSKEDRFRAILDEIKDYYPNIYKREIKNKNDIGSTGTFRYGWSTSHNSKEEIISYLNWALREGMYIERNQEAVDEMRIFERHEDGSLGNVVGKNNHDDRVITRALGIYFCYKKMSAPRLRSDKQENIVIKKVYNEMSI